MKSKSDKHFMTSDEAYEVIKKYDRALYDYYQKNAWCFGLKSIMYAEYLKAQYEKKRGNKDEE